MTTRDKIFQSDDIAVEIVEIPLWGVTVEVRGMSGEDRSRIFEALAADGGDIKPSKLYVEAAIASTYDIETGAPVFEPGDGPALLQKSAQAIDILAKAALRLSGMEGEASQDDAGKSVSEES